jgi:hypothetical protein
MCKKEKKGLVWANEDIAPGTGGAARDGGSRGARQSEVAKEVLMEKGRDVLTRNSTESWKEEGKVEHR